MAANGAPCERSYQPVPMQFVSRQVCTKCGQTVLTYIDSKGIRHFQKHGKPRLMKKD